MSQTTFPGGASASGACVGRNCFLLQNYPGYFGDTQEILTGTWSSNGTTVTAGSSIFTASDTGKLCWGSPQSNQAGPSAAGTFTFISGTQGTCSPAGSLVGAPSGNGMFTWGHDDTAAFVAATAALYTQPKCGSLILPAAHTMLKQGVSYTGSVAADCSVNIIGAGYDSVIELLPGFGFGTVTSSVGCISLGCFWNTTAATAYQSFSISGEYGSLSGISTSPASTLFTIGPGSYAIGVNLFNWATSASNSPQGANIVGTGPFGLGFAITNWGDQNMWTGFNGGAVNYSICQNCGGTNVTLKVTGLTYDYAGTYNGVYITASGGGNNGEFHGYGTSATANSGGFGAMSCDKSNDTVYLVGAKVGFGTPGASGIGFQFNNIGSGSNCVVHAKDTLFNGGGSGAAVNVQSGVNADFFDDGGNTFSSPAFTISGTLRVHHRESGTCTFSAGTTCAVTFAETFGNSTLPAFIITPVNPGGITFTVTALSTTTATITASSSTSLSVGWEASL